MLHLADDGHDFAHEDVADFLFGEGDYDAGDGDDDGGDGDDGDDGGGDDNDESESGASESSEDADYEHDHDHAHEHGHDHDHDHDFEDAEGPHGSYALPSFRDVLEYREETAVPRQSTARAWRSGRATGINAHEIV